MPADNDSRRPASQSDLDVWLASSGLTFLGWVGGGLIVWAVGFAVWTALGGGR